MNRINTNLGKTANDQIVKKNVLILSEKNSLE